MTLSQKRVLAQEIQLVSPHERVGSGDGTTFLYPLFFILSQLRPYVSYKTPYIVGKPITAQDILDIVRPDQELSDTSNNT